MPASNANGPGRQRGDLAGQTKSGYIVRNPGSGANGPIYSAGQYVSRTTGQVISTSSAIVGASGGMVTRSDSLPAATYRGMPSRVGGVVRRGGR